MIEIDKTFVRDKDEIWMRIPGALIQDIQLEDGTNFIKQYGNYDKYEFEILLKKDEEKNSNYRQTK